MLAYLSALRLLNRDIRFLLGMWALTAFAYFGIQGVLLNLYLLRLGYGPEFIGLLIGSGQLVWAAFALPAGMIGQRLGLRTALLAAHPLLAIGGGGILWAEHLPAAWQTAGLMAAWTVMWLGASLMTVNATPYMM